jgi:hypothetical protein
VAGRHLGEIGTEGVYDLVRPPGARGIAVASIGCEGGATMPCHAISADPADYACGTGACDQTPVIVTMGTTRPAVFAHCADHLPDEVTFPIDPIETWANEGG